MTEQTEPAVITEDVADVIINPFYVLADFMVEHEAAIDQGTWIAGNRKLIEELGTEQWLTKLLHSLEELSHEFGTPVLRDG